jgi:hypothetical protein
VIASLKVKNFRTSRAAKRAPKAILEYLKSFA